jgi:D-alanyl-D-alanine carboxypeptidase
MSLVSALQRCLSELPPQSNARRVSAAVRVNGRLHWTSTDADEGLLAGSAKFPVYSITKTLTAICVLRLSEIGSLAVTDSVRKWLPRLDVPDSITLAHLLRHASGLGDYGPLREYHDAVRSHPGQPWTRQRFLDVVLSKGMLFAPGDGWTYSNVGFMLLLEVLERVTGQGFASTLRDLLITPLALQRTFVVERIEDLSGCVPGHGPEVDIERRVVDVRPVYHPGWCAPGLVASTAEEITRVLDALLAGTVLEPATLADMLTLIPLSRHPGEPIGCGMGLYSDRASPRGPNYGHGGGGPGYDLEVTVFPETRLGRVSVAVFVNSSCEPRARQYEAALLSQVLDNADVGD